MNDIYLHCDSPCWSCPDFDRMRLIDEFSDRYVKEAFYCSSCDIYSLCKMGLAYRRNSNNKLKSVCTKCGRYLEKIYMSYSVDEPVKSFNGNSLLFIRKPNGEKFKIIQTVKGSYFRDLAEVLLYVLYNLDTDHYNIVNYDILSRTYKVIFDGQIEEEKIKIKYMKQ
ncbi:MAG: hypothetical protein ACTSO7_00120 [Candidatus Heimdallarchaeota archaeon]